MACGLPELHLWESPGPKVEKTAQGGGDRGSAGSSRKSPWKLPTVPSMACRVPAPAPEEAYLI